MDRCVCRPKCRLVPHCQVFVLTARLEAASPPGAPLRSHVVMSSFYHPSFPHSQDVADFANLSTDSLLPESVSQDHGAQVPVLDTEYVEEEQPQTSRQRRTSRPDHVKHRRTRNGCYTCRSRRVKVQLRVHRYQPLFTNTFSTASVTNSGRRVKVCFPSALADCNATD